MEIGPQYDLTHEESVAVVAHEMGYIMNGLHVKRGRFADER
jgi:hypothetical protein